MFFPVPGNLLSSSCACSILHHSGSLGVTALNRQGSVEMRLCQPGLPCSIQMSALMKALIMQSTGRRLGRAQNAHQRRQRDSPARMCLHRLTVCECACSPNRQSPFLSPSRASWIKMKDKHFLPLFSTSAGIHLINFLISLGTNDLRDSTNPKLSLFFILSTTKIYAWVTKEEEERRYGWQK